MKLKTKNTPTMEYRKKLKSRRKRLVFIFFSTFTVVFLLFISLASILTPTIELPTVETDEEGFSSMGSNDFKGRVDSRLKLLEMQEKTPPLHPGDKITIDEKVTQKAKKNAVVIRQEDVEDDLEKSETTTAKKSSDSIDTKKFLDFSDDHFDIDKKTAQKKNNATREEGYNPYSMGPPKIKIPKPKVPTLRQKLKPVPQKPSSISKVMVGDYPTPMDARKASQAITQSNPNVAPFIKENNGKYSLQVGSFSDPQKASDLADQLKKQNVQAEVVR